MASEDWTKTLQRAFGSIAAAAQAKRLLVRHCSTQDNQPTVGELASTSSPQVDQIISTVLETQKAVARLVRAGADPTDSSGPQVPAQSLQTGLTIESRYVLAELLGTGGFGSVFKAHDRILNQSVALKFIRRTQGSATPAPHREAAALRRARGLGVCHLLDHGTIPGWSFIAMKLVPGMPFPGSMTPPPSPGEFLLRTVRLLDALFRLHSFGLVHRDLKPSNILVDEDGRVTIVDLGLSQHDSHPDVASAHRRLGGTQGFIAPELLDGEAASPKSDLYSVGVSLLCAWRTYELQVAAAGLPSAEFKATRRELLPVLLSLVDDDPSRRPSSARKVARRLQRMIGDAAKPELKLLGRAPQLATAIRAVCSGRSVALRANPGAGVSRFLRELATALHDRGRRVVLIAGNPAVVRRASIPPRNEVLLVDDPDLLGREAREAMDMHTGPVVSTAVHGHTSQEVHLSPLAEQELARLIANTDRVFLARTRLLEVLCRATAGVPGSVAATVEHWLDSGLLCRSGDSFEVTASSLRRLELLEFPGLPHENLEPRRFSEQAQRTWRAMSHAYVIRASHAPAVLRRPDTPGQAELVNAGILRDTGEGLDLTHLAAPAGVLLSSETVQPDTIDNEASRSYGGAKRGREIDQLNAHLTRLRRGAEALTTEYDTSLESIAYYAISSSSMPAIDVAQWHAELHPAPHAGSHAWTEILSAAQLALRSDARGALARIANIDHSCTDRQLRLSMVVANMAALRTGDPAEQRNQLVRTLRLLRSTNDASLRGQIASWTGWLRFREGRYRRAQSLHTRALRLASDPRAAVNAACNAAAAAVESADLEGARRLLTQARRLAERHREHAALARIERHQRVVDYRLGEDQDIDTELLAACRLAHIPGIHALVTLTEAAIAWRKGDRSSARGLAHSILEVVPQGGEGAFAYLVHALAGVEERCASIMEEAANPLARSWTPIGIAAQATAVIADNIGVSEIPTAARARSVDWARTAPRPDYRRELLTPREILDKLAPD